MHLNDSIIISNKINFECLEIDATLIASKWDNVECELRVGDVKCKQVNEKTHRNCEYCVIDTKQSITRCKKTAEMQCNIHGGPKVGGRYVE